MTRLALLAAVLAAAALAAAPAVAGEETERLLRSVQHQEVHESAQARQRGALRRALEFERTLRRQAERVELQGEDVRPVERRLEQRARDRQQRAYQERVRGLASAPVAAPAPPRPAPPRSAFFTGRRGRR